jgi:hypothetical protein
MAKRYRVTLEPQEREELMALLARGKADVRRLKHAQILLKADEAEGGPAWSDARVAEAVVCGTATVERVRWRFVEEGLELAMSPYRTPRRAYRPKLAGQQEARLGSVDIYRMSMTKAASQTKPAKFLVVFS